MFFIFQIPGDVGFFGQPGGKLKPFPQSSWDAMIKFQPDVVFWCLGGNSITKFSPPGNIVKEVLEYVEKLKSVGVKKVYVSEISERGNFSKSPGLTKPVFDEKRQVINRRLRLKLKKEFVTFKTIKYPTDYDADLVHFGERDEKKGMRKYFFAVRGILLSYKTVSS